MKSESSKSFKQGFALNEQEIRRLYDVCCQQMKNATKDNDFFSNFDVKFQNGVLAAPASLDDILSQENIGSAAITRLSFGLIGNDSLYKIFVQFLDPTKEENEGDKSIKYKIEGEDRDWVFVTSSLIEERINRIKVFSLGKLFNKYVPLFLMQILLFISVLLVATDNSQLTRLSTIESKWNNKEFVDLGQMIIAIERSRLESTRFGQLFQDSKTVIILIAVLLLGIFMVGDKISTYLFPPYNFLWGDYIKFYESRKTIRNFIIIVVILGLGLSIVGNYIYGFLSRK